ncbi:uncharacterized protein LOC131942372 [Physella acuta]|uniref:uncharacterized protein LOC131942372 n=1 Tax=Physella acuta TaxID=109671 RepID=UPI0027DAFD07|nr:uncharacterized protein LOC131942372 [Physella acuta]
MGLKNDNWLLFVFIFVLTTDVVTADKTKVWWGRYTPDVRQTTDVQDAKASKDFRVSSSGNDAGWGEEFRPKDQYSQDNQLTWPEPDFRPFQAHDADVQWPDKSSKMLDSGTSDVSLYVFCCFFNCLS